MKSNQAGRETGKNTRRGIISCFLSILLMLSLVLSPVSIGRAAAGGSYQSEVLSVAADGQEPEGKQAVTAGMRIHYQYLTEDEKKVYDTIDSLFAHFSPISLDWDEIMDKVSEDKDGAAGFFREYLASGQAIKLEFGKDYSNEDGENMINTGVRFAYVSDHPLDMRAQLCGILSYIDKSTVYVCLYIENGYRDFERYQQEAEAAYEKDLAAIRADKRFDEGNKPAIELVIADYICSKIKYRDSDDFNMAHTTYPTLVYSKGVCEAIALYTCLLNNSFGVETYCLSSIGHAWNLVKLDDDYYELDNTWDLADDYGLHRHKYFNLTSKQIQGEKKKDRDESHDRVLIDTRLPVAKGTKYTYKTVWEMTGKVSEKPMPDDGCFPTKKKLKSKGFVFSLESDGTAVLTEADYKKGKITIPHHVKYKGWLYEVYQIDPEVFYNYAELKSIVLPKTVIVIGDKAFYGCKKLSNITLSAGDIGEAAFKGIRKNAHFYVQCEESEYDKVQEGIESSGAKKPQIEWVEE